ncbi:hypothetical protein IV203_005958 [Nitzschia inconspicua]|uniref:SGNH hydrolase-type esterase domain-containing protein n=1 Tax=Nitzschia inconspicua TaxID=303405 RepID=A0A9K3PJ80_9STRA|nr:hypothetical protein IV203_005958 [Nitzschia inconspicua]
MTGNGSSKRFSFYVTNGDVKDDEVVEMAKLTMPNKDANEQQEFQKPLYNIRVREDSNLNMMLGNSPAPDCSTFCAFVFAYITYTCQYAPKLCWTLAAIALVVASYILLIGVFFNPTEQFGVIEHDFTNVRSQYDFSLKDIKHWCIKGDNDSCDCEDPLQPSPRSEFRAWSKSHIGNIQQITNLIEADLPNPDIAFLGGSIIEKMDGKWFGSITDSRLQNLAKIFNKHFTNLDGEPSEGDSLTAVALGIAGDTNPAVLYRLLNGEMPKDFEPKIWWLELGMNDLGRSQCSEEIVILGILRVVEEIMNQKPNAKIVINSMFPMAELRKQFDPHEQNMGLEQSFGGKPKKTNSNNKGENQKRNSNNKANDNKNSKNKADKHNNSKKSDNGNKNGNNGKSRGLRHSPHDLPVAIGGTSHSSHTISRLLPPKAITKMKGNQKYQHKYNPVTHRENKLPLWTSIMAINKELAKFSSKHENVFFYDVTNHFTEQNGKYFNLKTNLILPAGLPTEDGYDLWERLVVTKARGILAGVHE